MPNTNFQTFHQMGQAINEVVRQATGRDNVQNIDMEHITVAQNHYYQDVDVSGPVVSFHAGAAGLPLEKCVVQIEPVQDLHGYDHPWPAGGGKNIINIEDRNVTVNGLNIKVENGVITLNGTTTSAINYHLLDNMNFSENTYTFSIDETILSNAAIAVQTSIGNKSASAIGTTFTASMTGFLWLFSTEEQTFNNVVIKPMIRLSTESDPTFEPYSNICPIAGWTGAQVYVSPTTDAADGQTYTIAFPSEAGTVYGGMLDAVSGVLVVDRMNIESYNGETLPGKWISDRDVYVEGATPTTGAQVVYELAEPITYQLTPTEITTLLGVNNVWADTGDIEVKFTDLKELY